MALQLDFSGAEAQRLKVTQEQQERIRDLYRQASEEIGRQAAQAPRVPSDTVRQQYLHTLQGQINDQLRDIEAELKGTIKSGMTDTAKSTIQDAVAFLHEHGLPIEGAYSRVPADVVQSVMSGQLYAGDWSLSRALWLNTKETQQDIQSVIAQGIAQNKTTYEIAKDLEKYVNPDARKDWEWSKVYPGTRKVIDYNAQRLARTMVSHAYQQSFVRVTQKNPFVTKYQWLASNSDRTCEICEERDGQLFEKDDLPLDHPNGMCTFLAVIDSSPEEIADRLADWANGAEDPELDAWAKDLSSDRNMAEQQVKLAEVTENTIALRDLPETTLSEASENWFEYEKCNLMKQYIATGKVPAEDMYGNPVSVEERDLIRAQALKLQEAAQKGHTDYRVLYRGMVIDEQSVVDFRRNAIYEMENLTSTAVDRKVASIYSNPDNVGGGIPVMMRIENPKGIRGYDRDGMEVILPTGAQYRVASSTYDEDGVLQVTLYASKGLG